MSTFGKNGMKNMKRIHLLIIDPQNDFCDLPEAYRPADPHSGRPIAPALPVSGAHADMQRLGRFIADGSAGIGAITLTLDSHQRVDIAHPTFWHTETGGEVAPFTPITAAQVRQGRFRPRDPDARSRTLAYLDELESRGRYTLMVWPVHCEIGSWGHNVHADVKAACNQWEERSLDHVEFVTKGTNPWTEHYSAMQAEVPDADDPDTQLNRALIERLDRADLIVIGGEASSHCVKATTEHLVDNLPGERLARVVLLTDCMSPVPGFEAQHASFLGEMRRRGATLSTTDQLLAQLLSYAR
jgi:nicotinamidase/pyrazinamidase